MLRQKYEKFDEKFKERNCILLTTFEEFKLQNTGGKKLHISKSNGYKKAKQQYDVGDSIKYALKCGHTRNMVIKSFFESDNAHTNCRECV